MQHEAKCRHCGLVKVYEHADKNPSIGARAEASGYVSVWDVSNGLTSIWLCPACGAEVVAAWRRIVELCGTDALSFAGVLRNYDRRAK